VACWDKWPDTPVLSIAASAVRPQAMETCKAPLVAPFHTDTPWSAAFVSYVLTRAGLPGFTASASHIDIIRAAYRHPDASPYVLSDPDSATPAAGDLLCFARGREPIGAQGLRDFPGQRQWQWIEHALRHRSSRQIPIRQHLYLVGGNVCRA
jgi:hypothetical protein